MIEDLNLRDKGMDRYVRHAAADMAAARDQLMAAIAEVGPQDWQRFVPYGSRTLHELLAHVAAADQTWALAASDLLKGESGELQPRSPEMLQAAQQRAVARGRAQSPQALLDEMARRRRLLLGLYELLEPRHLAHALLAFGDEHNSVREHIWRGYHDRLHAADIRRALRLRWYPAKLGFLPDVRAAAEALSPDETLRVVFSVDPVRWEQPSTVHGWSHRRLLAHIATGDWVLQLHLRAIFESGSVAAWPDIDAGNAERLEERRFSTQAALVEEYLSMRHETLLLISQLQQKQLALKIRLGWEHEPDDHTVLDYLLGFPWHERTHREQLRRAMAYLR